MPRGRHPAQEGTLTGQIAEAAGELILDLEPYSSFWQGTERGGNEFMEAYAQETALAPRVCLDHRRIPDGFPYASFVDAAEHLLPQGYWTDRRPWREVLDEAAALLSPYGKPIEYVLPGNADRNAFAAAVAWCAERGARASVWVWQTIRAGNWPSAFSL